MQMYCRDKYRSYSCMSPFSHWPKLSNFKTNMSDQEPFWNDSEIYWTLSVRHGQHRGFSLFSVEPRVELTSTAPGVIVHGLCCGLQTGTRVFALLAAIRPLMSLLPTRSAGQKAMLVGSQVKSTENTCTFSEKRKNCRQPLKDFLSFLFI